MLEDEESAKSKINNKSVNENLKKKNNNGNEIPVEVKNDQQQITKFKKKVKLAS